ncbi:MAG: RNA polymerase sigma-70 factor [Runella sp.]
MNEENAPKPENFPIPPLIVSKEKGVLTFTDDELFIRQAFEADFRQGVELLYKRYYQPLCTHAIRFVGSKEIAEDLVSEVFFQFYAQQTFQHITTSFRLYLFSTVRHRAYNCLRWELSRKADLTEILHRPIFVEQQPDQVSQYEELYHAVEQAVNSLPLERRKIYLMRKFEGKKYQEIADELNLSIKTVDVQLYRATQYIRKLLKNKWLISLAGLFILSMS